jgi:hypothetical protein
MKLTSIAQGRAGMSKLVCIEPDFPVHWHLKLYPDWMEPEYKYKKPCARRVGIWDPVTGKRLFRMNVLTNNREPYFCTYRNGGMKMPASFFRNGARFVEGIVLEADMNYMKNSTQFVYLLNPIDRRIYKL